ncbi:hypothetical protein [Nocardia sp. IFM 10818]
MSTSARRDHDGLLTELREAVTGRPGWHPPRSTGTSSVSTWYRFGTYYASVIADVDADGWYWLPRESGNPLPGHHPDASSALAALENAEAAIARHRAERLATQWTPGDGSRPGAQ